MTLELCVAVQSCVYREYRSGLRTQPCGAPVLRIRGDDVLLPILTTWLLPVRKSRIQLHRDLFSPRVWSFATSVAGTMVLNVEYCYVKLIQTLGRALQGVNWSLSQCFSESPRSDIFRKRATKPLLKQKHFQKHLTWAKEKKNWTVAQWSKVLFSDESKFCISFGNQGPRFWRKSGEAQNPCCLKSSVKFPQSVMIWAAMSSAGVGPLCFLKSTVNAAIYHDILEHFMLPSAVKLYVDVDFIFQQDTLLKVPIAGLMTMVLLCLILS